MILKKNDYFQYTITDDFKVHCWDLDKNPDTDNPFWFQHQHPSGEPWQNVEQIEAWLTEKFIPVREVTEEQAE